MQWILVSLMGAAILAFCAMVYIAIQSWPKIGTVKRIAALLLLVPHLLLVVCTVLALRTGNAPQGSVRFNQGFAASVFMMFILPIPALLGSVAALFIFRGSRQAASRK